MFRRLAIHAVMLLAFEATLPHGSAAASSLRFHGNGVGDIDRVKVRIDDPATSLPGPPADIGDSDWTIELWLRGFAADNPAAAPACGDELAWIVGNIVLDRDRYSQNRKFGLAIGAGIPVFGVSTTLGGSSICGAASVLDGSWHHIAVQRRSSDGHLWMYVDGVPVADEDGPDGLLSYPDNGVPGNFCGGPCVNSDPFIVFGAEKHDADAAQYPPFTGWLDEVRFSTVLRYPSAFARPVAPFVADAATAALWHFDEAAGDTILDSAGGGASGGVRKFGTGGARPAGPEWSIQTPFSAVSVPGTGSRALAAPRVTAWPTPALGLIRLAVELDATLEHAGGRTHDAHPIRLRLHDVAGRVLRRIELRAIDGRAEFVWDRRDEAGRRVPAGIVFAQVSTGAGRATATLVLE
ncbi:MAG: hypothetical protein HOP12_10750 [Candidatus Eisenbacteria bacterium]|uniref:LamG domain-containing protein n=1 Tax=Eiseniibacteriota bacterium TaxID=2212470 RepID=A0A849SJL4_UNCEI|nr:hypothetical protein [Candidatus Eisenbacteria bacterium]